MLLFTDTTASLFLAHPRGVPLKHVRETVQNGPGHVEPDALRDAVRARPGEVVREVPPVRAYVHVYVLHVYVHVYVHV